MKIRSGFVSNSSSSSFIVIEKDRADLEPMRKAAKLGNFPVIIDGSNGESEFGWGPEEYDDFWSKLNWAVLFSNKDSDLEMLKDIFKREFHLNVDFDLEGRDQWHGFGYVDHQSGPNEAPENGRMWESKEALMDWLFSVSSHIVVDNDNH